MKKSFTLIEILISITIFSILLLAMSNIIKELKSSKDSISRVVKKNDNYLIKTLYYDILNSDEIKILNSPSNNDYVRLYIHTSNSLYNDIFPYVVWYVSKNKKSLIRVEKTDKIKIPNDNFEKIDKFAENVDIFKIYKKERKYLIIIQVEKKDYIFEIYK